MIDVMGYWWIVAIVNCLFLYEQTYAERKLVGKYALGSYCRFNSWEICIVKVPRSRQ